MEKKNRNSNIELLRIFAMFIIVVSHYCVHNNFILSDANDFSRILIQFLNLGNIGTNLFIMISGYFYLNFKNLLGKLIKLKIEVSFYMISIVFLLYLFNLIQIDEMTILCTLFPIITKQYWFVSTYFLLLLIAPFLSWFLKKIKTIYFIFILILYFILISLLPTFFNDFSNVIKIFEFIFLYFLGAFLYKFKDKKWNSLFIGFIFVVISSFFMILNINYENYLDINVFFMHHRMHILSILMSLGFFIIFNKINIKNNFFINKISNCTFGVYLFHEHPLMRIIFWKVLFIGNSYKNTLILIPHLLISSFLVFLFGLIISFIYKYFEKITINKVKKYLKL